MSDNLEKGKRQDPKDLTIPLLRNSILRVVTQTARNVVPAFRIMETVQMVLYELI